MGRRHAYEHPEKSALSTDKPTPFFPAISFLLETRHAQFPSNRTWNSIFFGNTDLPIFLHTGYAISYFLNTGHVLFPSMRTCTSPFFTMVLESRNSTAIAYNHTHNFFPHLTFVVSCGNTDKLHEVFFWIILTNSMIQVLNGEQNERAGGSMCAAPCM